MRVAFALPLLFVASSCEKPAVEPRFAPGASGASITVTSPAFADGTGIPVDFTCDGNDVMPELVLSAPPQGTRSLVLLIDDPDAQAGVFTHMIAFNVAPQTHKVAGGADLEGLGDAARFGLNDFEVARYSGPCPPKGEVHRYRFRVLALDTMLRLPEGAPKRQIEEAMDAHILGEGMLMGHFGH